VSFLSLSLSAQSALSGWWKNDVERVEIQSHSRGLKLAVTREGTAYNLAGRWLRYPDLFEFGLQGRIWTAQVLADRSISLSDGAGKKVRWSPMRQTAQTPQRQPTGLPAPPRTGFLGEGRWISSSGNGIKLVARNQALQVEIRYTDGSFEKVPGKISGKSTFEYVAKNGRARYRCQLEGADRIRCLRLETGKATLWKRVAGGL